MPYDYRRTNKVLPQANSYDPKWPCGGDWYTPCNNSKIWNEQDCSAAWANQTTLPRPMRRIYCACWIGKCQFGSVTQGDFIGFLMQLKQKNLIRFDGSRNPDTKRIDRDSLRITISPMIAHLLTLSIKDSLDIKDIPGEKLEIQLPETLVVH